MRRPIFDIALLFPISVVVIMMLIVSAFASMTNNTLAYTTLKNSTMITANASSFSLDNIQTKKVRVDDIDIAYKIFG